MQIPVLFLKAHVKGFTNKNGVTVAAHETKVKAKAKAKAPDAVGHGIMRFRRKDRDGNIDQISVGTSASGDKFVNAHSIDRHSGKTGMGMHLSNYMFHQVPDLGSSDNAKVLHTKLLSAYDGCGGDHKKVHAALKTTTQLGDWSLHEHVPTPVNKPLAKSHVDAFTRKDGVTVQAHETKVTAKAPVTVAPGRHGGHTVSNAGKFMRNFDNKSGAQGFADSLNAAHSGGKGDHMASSVSEAARAHLGHKSLDEVGHDNEDFVSTGKVGLHHALAHAFRAGHGGNVSDDVVDKKASEIAAAHGMFDTLKPENSDRKDFTETSKVCLSHALSHAYGAGVAHSKSGTSKPAAKSPSKKAVPPDVHHSELQEGDGITDASGNNHYVSHVTRGLGRHVVHTESGYSHNTDSAGHLTGFKRNGKSSIHPDGKAKPLPKAPAKKAAPAKPKNDPHPNVIGKATDGDNSSFKFGGKTYRHTGKEGNSMHDSTPVKEAASDDGHRVWRDGTDRVHADSREEAQKLRGE